MIAVMKNQMTVITIREDGTVITMPLAVTVIAMVKCTFMREALFTLNGILNILVETGPRLPMIPPILTWSPASTSSNWVVIGPSKPW